METDLLIQTMNVAAIQKLLGEVNPIKSMGIDNLVMTFLTEGKQVPAKPITQLISQ